LLAPGGRWSRKGGWLAGRPWQGACGRWGRADGARASNARACARELTPQDGDEGVSSTEYKAVPMQEIPLSGLLHDAKKHDGVSHDSVRPTCPPRVRILLSSLPPHDRAGACMARACATDLTAPGERPRVSHSTMLSSPTRLPGVTHALCIWRVNLPRLPPPASVCIRASTGGRRGGKQAKRPRGRDSRPDGGNRSAAAPRHQRQLYPVSLSLSLSLSLSVCVCVCTQDGGALRPRHSKQRFCLTFFFVTYRMAALCGLVIQNSALVLTMKQV